VLCGQAGAGMGLLSCVWGFPEVPGLQNVVKPCTDSCRLLYSDSIKAFLILREAEWQIEEIIVVGTNGPKFNIGDVIRPYLILAKIFKLNFYLLSSETELERLSGVFQLFFFRECSFFFPSQGSFLLLKCI
jgi:hypothetical protein